MVKFEWRVDEVMDSTHNNWEIKVGLVGWLLSNLLKLYHCGENL